MIEPKDIVVCTWSSKPTTGFGTSSAQGIKIVHKPSGITVTCDTHRGQHKNRSECLRNLEAQLKYWKAAVDNKTEATSNELLEIYNRIATNPQSTSEQNDIAYLAKVLRALVLKGEG